MFIVKDTPQRMVSPSPKGGCARGGMKFKIYAGNKNIIGYK